MTGVIVDQQHPLAGACVSNNNNNNTILCLPSGRGSCTASQVLLELILQNNNNNNKAPAALILRDMDALVCVGAIVAQEFFGCRRHDSDDNDNDDNNVVVPPIVCLGHEQYEQLLLLQQQSKNNNDDNNTRLLGLVVEGDDGHNAYLYIGESIQDILQEKKETEEKEKNLLLSSRSRSDCVDTAAADDDDAVLQPQKQQQQLSTEELQRLQNASSEAERMALRVIYRYARLLQMMTLNHSNDNNNNNNHHFPTTTSSPPPPSYVPIAQAHIDGCTYIGPGGLQFAHKLVQMAGQVQVPTTLNAVSTDRRQWKALGVPSQYADNAIALGNAYLELGCQPSFTCAPYLLLPGITRKTTAAAAMTSNNKNTTSHGNKKQQDVIAKNSNTAASALAKSISTTAYQGQNWAWGESNAVVFANSVLGARTEKTADYLDICEAIAGIVPKEGVYLDKNREPTILLDARDFMRWFEMKMEQSDSSSSSSSSSIKEEVHSLFPVLGHLCGTLSDGRVPLLIGLENGADWISLDHLKSFCAAFGTTGTSPLIHIAGITPEARDEQVIRKWIRQCEGRVAEVTAELLKETYNILDKDNGEKIDLIALGNPHLSVAECGDLLDLVQQNGGDHHPKHPDVRVIACLSRSVQAEAEKSGHIHPLKEFGVEFVNDTCWCMLLDPPVIPARKDATILTNSGTYASKCEFVCSATGLASDKPE